MTQQIDMTFSKPEGRRVELVFKTQGDWAMGANCPDCGKGGWSFDTIPPEHTCPDCGRHYTQIPGDVQKASDLPTATVRYGYICDQISVEEEKRQEAEFARMRMLEEKTRLLCTLIIAKPPHPLEYAENDTDPGRACMRCKLPVPGGFKNTHAEWCQNRTDVIESLLSDWETVWQSNH